MSGPSTIIVEGCVRSTTTSLVKINLSSLWLIGSNYFKLTMMKDILHAKADCCPLFKSALIESVGKRLVECTQDLYWASGLPPRFTESTKPEFYPGKNHLGHVLESVRKDLVKEAVLVTLIDTDSQRDVAFPSSSASDDKPLPACSLSDCDKSAYTLDEPIEHRPNLPPPRHYHLRHSWSNRHILLFPPHHLKLFMLNPANKN